MPQQLEELGFTCGACGKRFRWKPELAGKSVKCKCQTTVTVPAEAGGLAQPKAVARAASAASAAPTARRSTASPSPAIAATKAARPAAKAPAPAPPPPPAEDDPFAALNALAEQEAGAAEGASETDDATRCPNCRSFLSPEAVLCTNCGFDRRKGRVLTTAAASAAGSENRGLFGFGKPKPESATKQKKEVVDKMAPQGSFVIGLVVSVVLAVLASVLWFGIAYAFDLDVFYLVLLVGTAAGFGMQIGQKGYSTFGGFAAALVALVVILGARVAVVVAVLLPLLRATSGVDSGEDPRVIMSLMDAEYAARGLDSEQTTVAQDEDVARAAEQKASALSDAEKAQMIADADRAMAAEPEPDLDAGAGMSAILMLIVFGGVKSFLFLLGALFLAFRTASGSVSG